VAPTASDSLETIMNEADDIQPEWLGEFLLFAPLSEFFVSFVANKISLTVKCI
jgi:hypothetical protein